ncbi:MAG: site-2 protease family protein [Anaerolineales bacterium]
MLNLTPAELIANVVVLIVAFTIHELAHALTADWFGDSTPRAYGRLTLNPLAHLDPLGSLLLLVAGFGWAKPVPINPAVLERRSPAAVMWVSLAGPLSNLMLAALAAIPFRLGWLQPALPKGLLPNADQIFTQFVFVNLILMLFNLLPLAPLDGEKIIAYFLPKTWAWRLESLRPYSTPILLGLLFLAPMLGLNILDTIIFYPAAALFRLLVL